MNPRKTLAYYDVSASTVTEPRRRLLREYAGIPDDQIDSHVEAIVGVFPAYP